MIRNSIFVFLLLVLIFPNHKSRASNRYGVFADSLYNTEDQKRDSLGWSVNLLNKLLYSDGEWYLTDRSNQAPMQGVLHYAQDNPLDTNVVDVRRILNEENLVYLIDRRPQDIRDFSNVPGYISDNEMGRKAEEIRKHILDSLDISRIVVPPLILDSELSKAPLVPVGTPYILLEYRKWDLPPAFLNYINRRMAEWDLDPKPSIAARDSVRDQIFETYRLAYNDSVTNALRERIQFAYRIKYLNELTEKEVRNYKADVKQQNFRALSLYNDRVVSKVNDSLKLALNYLVAHAEADSTFIRLFNLSNEQTGVWTADRDKQPIRMFLKNEQQDSLSVLLYNNGRNGLKLVIDDGIKLTRYTETESKPVTFTTKPVDKRLHKVELKKIVYPPWKLAGVSTLGFTQTSLTNWSKGGESSLALLVITKYTANYSKAKVRWENSAEFRYGVSQTKTKGFQKNDDKIEIQSRFGYSAFKNWFYSTEANFKTQIANGYSYPDKVNPISGFMAPGYLTFSVGLDYKPNKNFSLYLAPITSKTTFVSDTVNIAPSKFGLEPGKKSLWEPGLIVKSSYHHNLTDNISYDSKVELFNNYLYPFKKVTFEWEQTLVMQVNRFINVRFMTDLLYDYNTKFSIYDAAGTVIGKEPKWQFKELFTVGLTYKF